MLRIHDIAGIASSFDLTRQFFQSKGILRSNFPNCSDCGRAMAEVKDSGRKDGIIWRCPSHKGRKMSIRNGSYFEKSKLSLPDLLWLLFLWSHETPVKTVESLTGIGDDSIRQWYQYFRDACSHYLVNNNFQIGGHNVIVQIDETLVAKRKYNVGHIVPERWVFGGIDCHTKLGFLVEVQDRTAETLLPIIQQYIAPGSIIWSDCWAAYGIPGQSGISQIPGMNYSHERVNHTTNFVDPLTGCTTNRVEGMWKDCKTKFKAMHGVQSTTLASHLDEFMWRQSFKAHAFENILHHISLFYPV